VWLLSSSYDLALTTPRHLSRYFESLCLLCLAHALAYLSFVNVYDVLQRADSFFFLQRARRQVCLYELAEPDFERSIALQPSVMALRERAWMYEEMSAAAIVQWQIELVDASRSVGL